MSMKRSTLALGLVLTAGTATAKEEYQLPPEVTPAIRAACETDVRRLCIGQEPSLDKVKSCVLQKFFRLNKQCQVRLMAAGFSP
jgi:hypothetical protein